MSTKTPSGLAEYYLARELASIRGPAMANSMAQGRAICLAREQGLSERTIQRVKEQVRCNSGGPASRHRTERLRASILGKDDGVIRCPRVTRLALDFDRADPLTVMHALLREHGLEHAEQLREVFNPSEDRCICRLDLRPQRLRVADADPKDLLRQALLLGLCTTVLYDPQRPVLWTRSSLSRCLELYDAGGFYA